MTYLSSIDLLKMRHCQVREKHIFIPEAEGFVCESLMITIGLDGEGSTTCLINETKENTCRHISLEGYVAKRPRKIVKWCRYIWNAESIKKKRSTNSTAIDSRNIKDNCMPLGLSAKYIFTNILSTKLMLNNINDLIVIPIPSVQTWNKS